MINKLLKQILEFSNYTANASGGIIAGIGIVVLL